MSPIHLDRFESGVRLVIAFNETFNRHDVLGMMAMMSDECVFENTDPAPDGTRYQGKAAITQFWQDFFIQSPQAHIKIEEILGFGNRVVMLWRYDWVDEVGIAGHVRGVDLFRIQAGLITEKLSYVKG
jgi:predicted SnoaL-like aldol condensation-catalyzing enzyme